MTDLQNDALKEDEMLKLVKLLRSLTDTLPKAGVWGAEMDERGAAESTSTVDTPAEEVDDFT